MANISGIQGFIVPNIYPASTTFGDDSEDFSEITNLAVVPHNTFTTFDFIDGNDDGLLYDSDNETVVSPTNSTAGDRINVGGTTYFAQDMAVATVEITFTDNATESFNFGFRVFRLSNGDVLYNPLDSTVSNAAMRPFSEWASMKVTEIRGNNTGAFNLSQTTMSAQDDPFAVCFVRGTQITTNYGEIPVEDLKSGDRVLTADNGFQSIRWIGSMKFSLSQLEKTQKIWPIRIRAGALGDGKPVKDLRVSPQHRVLVRSPIIQNMFDEDEVLVPAKQLLAIKGIEIDYNVPNVEYYHILFDRHEPVFSNGATTESLYTGPMALQSVSKEAREEIFSIFPELANVNYTTPPCRPLIKGRKARQMAMRHKNKQVKLNQIQMM